jgi:TRAP-type C4-dicarboxylate transport system substrate-binding protein
VTRTINILLEENADFQQEWAGYKVFALYGLPEGNAYTNNAPIQGIDGFRGRDLRVSGELEEDTIDALGGMGSLIPMPEVYDALERGVVDGLLTDHAAIDTYSLYEVLEYGTNGMSMFYATKAIFMNEDTWNSLPADIQAIFEENSGLELGLKASSVYAEAAQRGIDKMEENGIEVYQWTEQDTADLLEVSTPVVEGFLDQLEASGLPAWSVYETLLEARDSLR